MNAIVAYHRRRALLMVVVVVVVLGPTSAAGQGLPLPGKQGLSARDYSRVRTWAAEGQQWRTSYAADPAAACSADGGLCAANPGSEDYGKLLVATSPADYDARTGTGGSYDPINQPVQDQRPCQSAVAFAVITAAEAAVASALHVNASSVSLSQQDLQFCPDAQRSCQEPWDVRAAVNRLVNGSIVAADCLPYTAATTDDPAKLCNYRCRDQPKLVQGGRFRAVPVRSPLEGQRQIRRYGSFVTRFNIYQDFLEWVRTTAVSDPTAVYDCPNSGQPPQEGHAIAVIGYNNTGGWWLVKNSWGTGNGDKGFFKVKFGVCGMLAPGDTLGVGFIPAQPVTLNVTGPVVTTLPANNNKTKSCYNYTAQPADWFSKVADAAVIKVGQLLLDNRATLKDLDKPLAGTQLLLLCDPDPTSVSTGAPSKAAADAATPNSTVAAAASPSPTPPLQQQGVPSPHAEEGSSTAAGQLPTAPKMKAKPAVATPEQEAEALRSLQEALGYKNPEWTGTNPCGQERPWPGLYCNRDRRVYMIDLSSRGLSGSLSDDMASLANIPFLQALWLFDNPTLSGTLPSSWSKLERLREVSLYGASLTGSLPASWGALKRLKHLYLHNNKLTGSLPEEWSTLGALQNLALATNEFSGSIPSSWIGMRNLKSISLYDNAGLSGCIPPTWLKPPTGQRAVKLAKPTDNIRPLAGTKLCRTCSDSCRAASAAGSSSGSSKSSKAGRTVQPVVSPPTQDPLAGITGAVGAGSGRVIPVLPPLAPPPPSTTPPTANETAAVEGSGPKPPVPPTTPGGQLPPPAVPPTLPGAAATGPNATAAAGAGAGKPGPAAAGANATGSSSSPVNPADALERSAVRPTTTPAAGPQPQPQPQPSSPSPLPAAASPSPAPAAAAGAASKLDTSTVGAAAPAPAAAPAVTPVKPAAATGATAAAQPPVITAGTPPAPPPAPPPAAPPPPPPTPPPIPPPAPPPPAVPAPTPVGSLPVPVDPSLTVIRDNRKPSFQDMELSGRRRLVVHLHDA